MRTILLSSVLGVAVFTCGVTRAQEPKPTPLPPIAASTDDATQQQIDKISAQIQDLLDQQAAQGKRIAEVEKKVSDLEDKISQPGGATPDDLKKLADQVQEIDKKRLSDNEQILKELEKLDKALGVAPSPTGRKVTTSNPPPAVDNPTPPANVPQKGYEYTVAKGDNLSAIAKAYRAQGVKVTVEQIQAANPGLSPKNLIVGKKIFIPDASAK
ncbi:MAG TPA: LysM peptidoglycan-binding domain-containing protein [Desulfuromonadaceae bacterium]|nr:LysM peptidoglycan-binding domain-containing protein [Desulfuromonadaceae bacterium]